MLKTLNRKKKKLTTQKNSMIIFASATQNVTITFVAMRRM